MEIPANTNVIITETRNSFYSTHLLKPRQTGKVRLVALLTCVLSQARPSMKGGKVRQLAFVTLLKLW